MRKLRYVILGVRIGVLVSIILFGFIIFDSLSSANVHASDINTVKKHILFISSYSESYLAVPEEIQGLRDVFDPEKYSLDIEYMDTKRMTGQDNAKHFFDYLSYKLTQIEPYDLVITGDDSALQFMMDYRKDLFDSQIPVVFFGVNDLDRAQQATEMPDIEGGIEETAIGDNIALGLKLFPETKTVISIVDQTLTGMGDRAQFEKAATQYPDLKINILDMGDLTFDELEQKLEKIPSDSFVIFQSMNQDRTGELLDLNEQFELIRRHCSVPVFRSSIGGVGKGILGGKMIDYRGMAVAAAEHGVKILDGMKMDSKRISPTVYQYRFDHDLLKKYHINDAYLPKGTEFVNMPLKSLIQYRVYILTAGVLFFVLFLFTLLLLGDNLKRRKLEKELRENNEELAATYEELIASQEELNSQYELMQQHSRETDLLNQKFEIAIASTDSAVWELDLTHDCVTISKNISQILRLDIPEKSKPEEIMESMVSEKYRKKVWKHFEDYLKGTVHEIDIRFETCKDEAGSSRWMLIRGKMIEDETEQKVITGIFMDVSELKEQEDYMSFVSKHDYLTNLPNRRYFMELMNYELETRGEGAIMLFDLDEFKTVNDTMGHLYGDLLLSAVADRMRENLDEQMTIARIGGDEFLVLLPDCNKESAELCARHILELFSEVFIINNVENYITISMGVTCYPSDSDNIDQLLMYADMAMYHVKKSEKNNFEFYQESMIQEVQRKKEIERQLRIAITEQKFQLLYQPQVNCRDGSITGFEALLRMEGIKISPAEFIPMAESTGQIVEIGRWVAKEAARKLGEWKKSGLGVKKIAINYSAKQMRDKGYIEYLDSLLAEYEITADMLEIEITEGILVDNNQSNLDFLNRLKERGYSIALDDFGTGYSSLNYLTYLPVDKIKLDKSISDRFFEVNQGTVISSLIALSHSLDLHVVAEGVEEWNTFRSLEEYGCDCIQGYLFSRPLSADKIEQIYHNSMDLSK